MANFTIHLDCDARCPECGKTGKGVCDNGICLDCTAKAMRKGTTMKSAAGRAVQERWRRQNG
jgi:hypothetical protein